MAGATSKKKASSSKSATGPKKKKAKAIADAATANVDDSAAVASVSAGATAARNKKSRDGGTSGTGRARNNKSERAERPPSRASSRVMSRKYRAETGEELPDDPKSPPAKVARPNSVAEDVGGGDGGVSVDFCII